MIEYVKGKLVSAGDGWIVVEAGGVGLRLRVHDAARFRRLAGRPARVPAWLEFSPRRLELYGFADEAERERFVSLMAIPGIGPATALRLLPAWAELSNPAGGRVPAVPGVGPAKIARISKWLARRGRVQPADAGRREEETARALRALGMSAEEARGRAASAVARAPGATVEELVRLAAAARKG